MGILLKTACPLEINCKITANMKEQTSLSILMSYQFYGTN